MLDIKQIRKEPEKIRELLSRRGEEAKIDALLAMDVERGKFYRKPNKSRRSKTRYPNKYLLIKEGKI